MKGLRVKLFMISRWTEGTEENLDELNLRKLQYCQDLGVLLLNSARLSDDFERGGEIAAWAAKKWKKYRIKKNCRLLLPSSRHTQIVYTFAILYAHRTNLLLLNFFFFIVHNPGAKIISGEKRMTCCISYHTAELAICLWQYVSNSFVIEKLNTCPRQNLSLDNRWDLMFRVRDVRDSVCVSHTFCDDYDDVTIMKVRMGKILSSPKNWACPVQSAHCAHDCPHLSLSRVY